MCLANAPNAISCYGVFYMTRFRRITGDSIDLGNTVLQYFFCLLIGSYAGILTAYYNLKYFRGVTYYIAHISVRSELQAVLFSVILILALFLELKNAVRLIFFLKAALTAFVLYAVSNMMPQMLPQVFATVFLHTLIPMPVCLTASALWFQEERKSSRSLLILMMVCTAFFGLLIETFFLR